MAVLLGENTTNVPALAREALRGLAAELEALDRRVKEIEVAIMRVAQRQRGQPPARRYSRCRADHGIGDRRHYYRPFSVPLRSAPCGLDRAGAQTAQQRRQTAPRGISKQGDRYLRRLLVLGATAVIRHSRSKSTAEAGWLKSLLERRPARLVSVAQANKTARIVWALLVRGEAYRMPAAVPSGVA
jgi:transposase